MNALEVLSDGGTILLHDLNPRVENRQLPLSDPACNSGTWNGDVWKVVMVLRQVIDLDLVVIDVDHGVGVLRVTPNTHILASGSPLLTALQQAPDPLHAFSYQDLETHRPEILPLVSMLGFRVWLARQQMQDESKLLFSEHMK